MKSAVAQKSFVTSAGPGRIGGLDVARMVAMLGMMVTHYIFLVEDRGLWSSARGALNGRAMPLFVILGGVGVAILIERRSSPDQTLLIRGGIVFLIGLALDELDTGVRIILQAYGLFFALSPILRRLSSRCLLGLAAVIAVTGSWTYQVMTGPVGSVEFDSLSSPFRVLWLLLFAGDYPFFPGGSFFVVGMVLGRLPLGSVSVAVKVAVVGAAATVVPLLTRAAADGFGLRVPGGPTGFSMIIGQEPTSAVEMDRFEWSSLLATYGHSQMLGWVISSTGSALLILGLATVVANRWGRLTKPAETVGRMALTFYVAHIVPTAWYKPIDQPLGRQVAVAVAFLLGFAIFALVWNRRLGSGPLERLLRIGSSGRQLPRRSSTGERPSPTTVD